MTRPGHRPGVPIRPPGGDLARKAVVVGAVLAAVVVFLAALTVVWVPGEDGIGPASFLGPVLAKKGESKSSDSEDSGSGRSSKSSKKHGSSKKGGSSRSASSEGDSDGSGSSGGGSGGSGGSSGGSSSGAGPTGTGGSGTDTGQRNGPMVNISCTKEVRDEAGLREALASAGPNDVICVKANLGRSATSSTQPSAQPSPSPATPTPSALPSLGIPIPSGGPISTCGPGATCRQTNRTSGPSADRGSGDSGGSRESGDGTTTKNRSLGSPEGGRMNMDPAAAGFTGPPGATMPKRDNCTKQVDGAGLAQAVSAAAPGDRICVTGDSPNRLTITKGGSDQAPITVVGDGRTSVKGITVKANNVVVDGFQVLGAQAPGIELTGDNLTAQNNTVKHPTGGDFDGLRFFGNNIRILHNTITDINPDGGSAHADCMQTFTSGKPASQHVLIDGNRCEKIANICLMAEGPGDVGDGGGGNGTSADWTFSNNVCQYGAGQGVMVEAVQNVTIRNNQFEGRSDKAIGLDIGSTGATVAANLLGQGIDHEVGMDAKSRQGYRGPAPQGGP